MNLYFITKNSGTDYVGQFTFEEIRSRYAAGDFRADYLATHTSGLSFNEFVKRGGAGWLKLDELLLLGAQPPPPPPPPVLDRQASPSKTILYFAVGLLAAFFMPWFQLLGVGVSGYQIGQRGSYGNYAWIIPILSGVTIAISLSGKNNRGIGALTGFIPILALIYAFIRIRGEAGPGNSQEMFEIARHVFSIGAYLTLIFSVCLLGAAACRSPAVVLTASESTQRIPQDKLTQLERLANLRSQGVLSEAEFEAQKRQILE